MREMKDSGIEWIGEIPREWDVCKAKTFATINNGSDPKSDGDIPVYGSGTGSFKTCGEYKEGPAVLLGRKGSIDIPRLVDGKYWNVDTAFDATVDSKKYDVEFYYYVATCFDYKYYVAMTTIPSMTQTNYGNMYVPCPAVSVQKSIVEYIKRKCAEIDALIAAKEKTNALLKERRQSIIYEAVTKGLDPTAPMKDSGVEWIGMIPEGWNVKKTKYCFTIIAGATPKTENSEYWDGDIAWVTPADYKTEDVYVSVGRKNISEAGLNSCATTFIPANSLIFSKRAPVGLVAINSQPLCTNQGCLACVPNKDVNEKFYYYAMSSCTSQYELLATGTTFKEISAEAFSNFVLPAPGYDVQKRIADYLDAECAEIDAVIRANESTIEKLKEYRQSVIYEAVTGKVEV